MDEDSKFDAKALRESAVPLLTRAEVAKKMGVSWTFLDEMETGLAKWPQARKEQYIKIVAEWQKNPVPEPRKVRSDAGLTHRMRKRRKSRAKSALVPVPHSHHEIVGIG